jgi:hypothetical protein
MLRALIVAAVLSASLAQAFARQQAVFRAETDLVSFGVIVTDKRGNFLTDLTTEDFELLEDGKPQTLKYFIRGQQTDAAPELHIGIMFDTSGSMASDIGTARTAAIKFSMRCPRPRTSRSSTSTPKSGWRNTASRTFRAWSSASEAASPTAIRRCMTPSGST